MGGKLAGVNRYGYGTDAFDKNRESVRKSNRCTVRVLSVTGIAGAMLMAALGVLLRLPAAGFCLCAYLLAAGVAGVLVSFRGNPSGGSLLLAGYLVSAGFYMLAVFSAVTMNTDAFWIGVQVAAGCFLLDYAWRIGLLQLLSCGALYAARIMTGAEADPERLLFTALVLLAGLVTFYTVNRTRVSLIMGQEAGREAAGTDLLTGLTIRPEAEKEIEEHLKTDDHGVMMLLDLDRFKSVNDRLGHQIGDKVLVDVAADLKRMFRNSDVLSRLGGDEFVVYLKSVPEKEWAMQRASHVVREIRRWVGNGTTNVQVTVSVGIVMTDMVARNYDDLYRAADIAMYTAKAEGGNKALFYDRNMLDQRETAEAPVRTETSGGNGATGGGTGR